MGIDPYENANPGIDGPAESGFVVTPSDTVDLPFATRAIWVGGTAGNIKVDFANTGTAVVIPGVTGLLQIRVTRIYSTDTVATGIVGLY